MSRRYSKILPLRFAQIVERTTARLGQAGFGIITEIDAKDGLRKKIGTDFRSYRIPGACTHPIAREIAVTPRARVIAHSVAAVNNY